MTIQELERLAEGVNTGYKDRDGKPIHVGDEVIYYKLVTKTVKDIRQYPKQDWYSPITIDRVYTHKVMRYRHRVTFSFYQGLEILEGHQWKFYHETDDCGNLLRILVDNEHKNPKLTYEQVRGYYK